MAVVGAITAIASVLATAGTEANQATVQHDASVESTHAKNDQLRSMTEQQNQLAADKKESDVAKGNAVAVARQRAVARISSGSNYGGTLGTGASTGGASGNQKTLLGT